MLGPHRCGAQLDQRHRIGMLAPHALDLIGKIDHAVDATTARGREGESLSGLWIDQVHEAGVLPGIARLAVRAVLPLGPIAIAEFSALRHRHARLAHAVFDWLAALPLHPGGGGGDGDELAAFLDRLILLADDPRLRFRCRIIPAVSENWCRFSFR